MKTATLVFFLAVCVTSARAQSSAAPSGDVTIELSEGTPEYCLGGSPMGVVRAPDDITLRLPLKLRYENHRSETIFLPRTYGFLWGMTVAGQNEFTILRRGSGGSASPAFGLSVKSLMALSRPDDVSFWIVSGGNDASSKPPNFYVLKLKGAVDANDFVMLPVLVHSSGLDLRGKTVQISTTRDFRSAIAPGVVETLNDKWKDYGIIWARVVESDILAFQIPQEPLAGDCRTSSKPLPRQPRAGV